MTVPPCPGEVHLRHFDLDQQIEPLRSQPCVLSADEESRADRFHFEQDAHRWVAGRSLLRRTLGSYLGKDPKTLRFETGPWGKPGLPDCPLRFNLSHSGGLALLAVSWGQEVGIDLERGRLDFLPEDLAPQVFSEGERSWLFAQPAEMCSDAFFSLWTAKEAYVKVGGKGLSFPITRLTLTPSPETDRFQVDDRSGEHPHTGVSVRRLQAQGQDFPPGCFAALALEGTLGHIRNFDPE